MNKTSQRPGMISDYENSSVRSSTSAKLVGIAAKTRQGKSLEPILVETAEDAVSIFGGDGDQFQIVEMVHLVLQNGGRQVLVASVSSNEDYNQAFYLLMEYGAQIITCDMQDETVLLLKDALVHFAENGIPCIGVFGLEEDREPVLSTLTARLCCERLVLTYPSSVTAAAAGLLAGWQDLSSPVHSVALRGLKQELPALEEEQVDFLILHGVSPAEGYAGVNQLIRCVSTCTAENGGEDDDFKQINAVFIYDDIISSVRNALRKKFRLSPQGLSRDSILNEVLAILLQKRDAGILESFAPPSLSLLPMENGEDALLLELSFSSSQFINRLKILAEVYI